VSPAPAPVRPARLLRSRDDKVIAGVCGGLASYLGVDVVALRVAAVALGFFTGGTAVIAYIVGWVIIPEARPGELQARERHGHSSETTRWVVGAVLIGLGGLWLITNIIPGIFAMHALWPIVLIAVGVFIVVQAGHRR
jgi:phage shock protein PspC (stress-responsive transcriptional regulator)